MKLLLALLLASFGAHAHNYFVSTSGTDSSTWRSIAQVNAATLYPGDSVLFQRGEIFFGTLMSKPGVVYTAYGTGADPVITGFNVATYTGGGIAEIIGTTNMVVINGRQYACGRYPNSGYIQIGSHVGNTSIVSTSKLPNLTGAQVVIRKKRWVIDRNQITSNDSTKINYTPLSGSATQYNPQDKWGFFIQNHETTLDQYGEWVSSNGKTLIYLGTDSTKVSHLEISGLQHVIIAKSNTHFIGLRIEGANENAINVQGNGVKVIACTIQYAGANGIGGQADSLTVTGCNVSNVNNNAIAARPVGNYATITGNSIYNTGMIPGAGASNDLGQEAIIIGGHHATITGNTIKTVGYTGIRFNNAADNLVQNNYIDSFGLVKDDCGGIYTWNNGANPDAASNNRVIGNMVFNAIGNAEGANSTKPEAYGIYMDDNAFGVTVDGNTIVNAHYGIVNHNGHDITYRNNIIYKSRAADAIWWKDRSISVKGLIITGNIFFNSEVRFWDVSGSNSISGFGVSDSNYYKSGSPINVAYPVFNATYVFKDLTGWRAMYGKDKASKTYSGKNPMFVYAIDKPVTYKLSKTYKDHTGKYYSGSITIPAYSSKILVQ